MFSDQVVIQQHYWRLLLDLRYRQERGVCVWCGENITSNSMPIPWQELLGKYLIEFSCYTDLIIQRIVNLVRHLHANDFSNIFP